MKLEGSQKNVAGANGRERERTGGEPEFLGAGGKANMGANAGAEAPIVSRPMGVGANWGTANLKNEADLRLYYLFPAVGF